MTPEIDLCDISSIDESPHPKAQIYVDNLPKTMSKQDFVSIFEAYGEVSYLKFLRHRSDGQTGYGFVAYSDENDAYIAISNANGRPIGGHHIRVAVAKPECQLLSTTNLYVCGLPLNYRSEQLKELFCRFGEITEARVLNNTTAVEAKGVGFVHFNDPEDAKNAAQNMNRCMPKGMNTPLIVKFARDIKRSNRTRYRNRNENLENGVLNKIDLNVCRYYQSGRCNRGETCNYAHIQAPMIFDEANNNGGGNTTTIPWQRQNIHNYSNFDPNFNSWSNSQLDFTLNQERIPVEETSSKHLSNENNQNYWHNSSETQQTTNELKEDQLGKRSKTNLYVSQFPCDWTVEDLEKIFLKYGSIDKTRILTPDNAEKNRGVGFVHFKDAKSASKAISETQNFVPKDCTKPIVVKYANQGTKGTRCITTIQGICRFWAKGECTRGDLCSFRHDGPGAISDDFSIHHTTSFNHDSHPISNFYQPVLMRENSIPMSVYQAANVVRSPNAATPSSSNDGINTNSTTYNKTTIAADVGEYYPQDYSCQNFYNEHAFVNCDNHLNHVVSHENNISVNNSQLCFNHEFDDTNNNNDNNPILVDDSNNNNNPILVDDLNNNGCLHDFDNTATYNMSVLSQNLIHSNDTFVHNNTDELHLNYPKNNTNELLTQHVYLNSDIPSTSNLSSSAASFDSGKILTSFNQETSNVCDTIESAEVLIDKNNTNLSTFNPSSIIHNNKHKNNILNINSIMKPSGNEEEEEKLTEFKEDENYDQEEKNLSSILTSLNIEC